MSDAQGAGQDTVESFETIDAQLTMFALANGMDLSKGEGYRRLEWFLEGFERAIMIESENPESFRVRVMSWPSGSAESRRESTVGEGMSAKAVGSILTDTIDSANEL